MEPLPYSTPSPLPWQAVYYPNFQAAWLLEVAEQPHSPAFACLTILQVWAGEFDWCVSFELPLPAPVPYVGRTGFANSFAEAEAAALSALARWLDAVPAPLPAPLSGSDEVAQ